MLNLNTPYAPCLNELNPNGANMSESSETKVKLPDGDRAYKAVMAKSAQSDRLHDEKGNPVSATNAALNQPAQSVGLTGESEKILRARAESMREVQREYQRYAEDCERKDERYFALKDVERNCKEVADAIESDLTHAEAKAAGVVSVRREDLGQLWDDIFNGTKWCNSDDGPEYVNNEAINALMGLLKRSPVFACLFSTPQAIAEAEAALAAKGGA